MLFKKYEKLFLKLSAKNGKNLSAFKLFSEAIKFLKDTLKAYLHKQQWRKMIAIPVAFFPPQKMIKKVKRIPICRKKKKWIMLCPQVIKGLKTLVPHCCRDHWIALVWQHLVGSNGSCNLVWPNEIVCARSSYTGLY